MQAHGLPFELMSFEGDPIAELCAAAETRDLVVTGHDTAFRGNVREQVSEVLTKLLFHYTPKVRRDGRGWVWRLDDSDGSATEPGTISRPPGDGR